MRFRAGTTGLLVVVLAALAGCGTQASAGPEDAARKASARSSPLTSSATANARPSSAELQGRWWTWAASEPEKTNPVADQDGSACGLNQPQDVWFLAGTFGGQVERACKVPAGRPIAFPLVNRFGDRSDCAAFMSNVRGTVRLDGRAIEPETYQGDLITVQSAQGNAVTGEEGRFTATGCGLWVQLPSLAPGKHSLKIRGQSDDFSTGVDYALSVAASSE
ncbi:signal protein [Streptomyces sp. NPDC004685]